MNRRNFIRLAGGGTIAAATVGTLAACGAVGTHYPAEAVEAWQGPVGHTEVRRRAVAYAITAPNPHNLQPWLVDLREEGDEFVRNILVESMLWGVGLTLSIMTVWGFLEIYAEAPKLPSFWR